MSTMPGAINPYFMTASRRELDVNLVVKKGEVPDDLCGHVFINSSVGTVNSGGLPFPKQRPDGSFNPEQGSPLLGGDSMIYRYDLDVPGQIRLKSRLLRPPCYYADEATQYWKNGKENPLFKLYGFRNYGLSRMSLMLGVRNELCTAVLPIRFPRDKHSRILANYDAGRPYEFDPESLAIKTPIGSNKEWKQSLPDFLDFPFPLVQSTAHPCFDPVSQELFTVNYTKSMKSFVADTKLIELLRLIPGDVEKKLENKIAQIRQKHREVTNRKEFAEKAIEELNIFFKNINKEVHQKQNFWQGIKKWFEQLITSIVIKETTVENAVYLMRWKGEGLWEKWKLTDADTGKPIAVQQCMHQTGLSKDFVILIDAGFKITLDIMMNNPFPNNPEIDAFIRQITTAAMLDHTPAWIVRRSDLVPGQSTAPCRALPVPLDYETIHFSADYDNPNGQITLHCAHNCTGCFAEWVRFYDKQALDHHSPVPDEVVGIPPSGIMDINRIGKYVIDGNTGQILKKDFVALTGNMDGGPLGPNTWGLVLYAYRDMISAEQPVPHIKNIFWQMYGLDETLLTDFIYNMYKDYAHRAVPVPQMEAYTRKGVPFCLGRMNTETMQFEDFYQFKENEIFRSIQFVPRHKHKRKPGLDPSLDGYIFCTVIVGKMQPGSSQMNYESQIWLFDAAKLSEGPTCILAHPELFCGSTLHSAWLPDAHSEAKYYNVDVRQDYQPLIDKTFWGLKLPIFNQYRKQIQAIFDRSVYPNF